eukprot:1779713-Pyramimonas_sp.AAC.1
MTRISPCHTWFQIGSAEGAALGKTDTRVGMPLADYWINSNFWPGQHDINDIPRQDGLICLPPPALEQCMLASIDDRASHVHGPSYVDDLVALASVDQRDRWAQALDNAAFVFLEAAAKR